MQLPLNLTSVASATTALKSGHTAVVPGKPDMSALLARLTSADPDELMPPPDQTKRPTAAQVARLREWIAEGTEWKPHWAYVPVPRPPVPAVKHSGQVYNAVDAFIVAGLESRGIEPSPEEVDAFVADAAPDAFEKLVGRALASPHFGERWGRHWLDMARYADSDGYEKDSPRPDAWRYRAWVIGAVNADMAFDEFTVEQLAGDLLPDATPEQRLATGYLEYAVEDGAWQRADGDEACLLPLSEHVLKFRLPPLPPGKAVKYRIVARAAGWVKARQFYHGEFKVGAPQISQERSFRTLDPAAETTTFAVWNDTHENAETLKALNSLTNALRPDFMLWNGHQSNDVHFEKGMAGQFLSPAGLAITDKWPLACVRGNHDVRGPAAGGLPEFTGTPGARFYYGFRSGPMAALVMDTGEDKPDDSP